MNPLMMCISLCGAFAFGHIHKIIALRKGRNAIRWFWFGFFFGALGLPFILLSPKVKKKPSQNYLDPKELPNHPLAQKMWYYLEADGTQKGPMSWVAFAEAKAKQLLTDESYVWTEEFSDWKKLKELPSELLESK